MGEKRTSKTVEETANMPETPSSTISSKSHKNSKKKDKKDKSSEATDTKEDRKRQREEKKQAKAALLDQVPKVDKDGISYTKQQVRRMVRRAKRGLTAIPTPQEEHELKMQDAAQRKEDELQWAGMLYNKGELGGDDDDSDSDDDAEKGRDDNDSGSGSDDEDEEKDKISASKREIKLQSNQPTQEQRDAQASRPAKKQKLSKKPVPKDYVCQACKNKHDFPHWIYNCPDKVTMKGTNQVSASGHDQAPSAKKVFVSGLPFDAKATDIKNMFSKECQGTVTSLKLLKFPDTGRCKGQAFVVFDTEESASKALRMSGTKVSSTILAEDSSPKKSTKKKGKEPAPDKELELKVTRVQNRSVTKARRQ